MQTISRTSTSPPDLQQLKTFALVAESGSFTAAAEQLGLSQPAVSTQIRTLERRLMVKLLERVGKRATPTNAGVELLAHISRIEAAVQEALSAVASHVSGVGGRVRLGTGATACLYFLPPILRRLRVAFPSLHIVVSTGNTDDYVRKLERNEIDLALVTLPINSRSLVSTPVLQEEFVALAPKEGGLLPKRATPAEMSKLPLVLFESPSGTRRLIDGWFAVAGLKAQPVMELGSVEAIKEMVAAGLGCGIVPAMSLTGRGDRKDLVHEPMQPRLRRSLALVMRRDKPLTIALQKVIEAIKLEAAARHLHSR